MASHDEGVAGTIAGRVVDSYVDENGVTIITDMKVDSVALGPIQKSMYELLLDHYPYFPGGVDDGPDAWAVALAAGIVSMAIALAILAGRLI